MPRNKIFNTKYSPEFKISVILDMRSNNLSYHETMRKYFPEKHSRQFAFLKKWERIYLEEGEAGLFIERRGRTRKMDNQKKGRHRKKPLSPEIEKDLIAENQALKEKLEYLEAENAYLKKLDALVRAREQKNTKKHK